MMKITELISLRDRDAYKNRPARIACLGDSVTHGCFEIFMDHNNHLETRYDSGAGYVRALQDALFMYFPACAVTVANCGISGDGSQGALERFDRDVTPLSPDLVTVNLGLNDCMAQDADAGLKNYRENMRAIFRKINALGAEAMLVTPNMMCEYVDPALPEGLCRDIAAEAAKRQTGGILSAFVDTAREVAAEANAPVADAYAAWQALNRAGADTTRLLANHINHPTREMHGIFTQKILEKMI